MLGGHKALLYIRHVCTFKNKLEYRQDNRITLHLQFELIPLTTCIFVDVQYSSFMIAFAAVCYGFVREYRQRHECRLQPRGKHIQ